MEDWVVTIVKTEQFDSLHYHRLVNNQSRKRRLDFIRFCTQRRLLVHVMPSRSVLKVILNIKWLHNDNTYALYESNKRSYYNF